MTALNETITALTKLLIERKSPHYSAPFVMISENYVRIIHCAYFDNETERVNGVDMVVQIQDSDVCAAIVALSELYNHNLIHNHG
jgi:hypothetical protein